MELLGRLLSHHHVPSARPPNLISVRPRDQGMGSRFLCRCSTVCCIGGRVRSRRGTTCRWCSRWRFSPQGREARCERPARRSRAAMQPYRAVLTDPRRGFAASRKDGKTAAPDCPVTATFGAAGFGVFGVDIDTGGFGHDRIGGPLRVLITGACGFVGRTLKAELKPAGMSCVCSI